ncbi:MAG TPA: adenylate/guanylate cyclase domain-containing protein [Candidatus Binatia bacterium]|jgi:TOMM system kinase/cyclase fusion protein|nr:adenylate/guanylate cyclase domain-containing protein [Candidatus Binatia bacterium]
MTFAEVRAQVVELLQREGRVAYRVLKRQFALDDEYLEDLKADLIDAKRMAVDEDGKVLVWAGDASVASSQFLVASSSLPPAPQTADSGLRTPDFNPQTLDSRLPEAERRQLTVMFCDLVGSTALSAQLDPEELREVVRAYQQTSAAVINRYAGHIAQYLGDGLLVYFGYPVAHEDDAQRAVHAGLEIIVAIHKTVPSPLVNMDQSRARQQAANAPLPHGRGSDLHPLQVRIGIHTGPVVVGAIGSGGRQEQLALGEVPNIAARVQALAEPDTMVLSAATHRLVAGLFECQDLGPQTLKGIATPLAVHRVVRESEAQSRFEVAVSTGLTPLVGRDLEVGLLRERWAQAKGGDGQAVLLSGEAGIGKSRLVQALKEQVIAEGATRIEFRCSPYHQNSAFYPIIDHLQRLLQFHREESPSAKLEKLQQALARYRFPQADTVPLLAALLSLPQPEHAPPLTLSPQKQKQRTQETFMAWLGEEAERQAVYCVWEDLHWADPSTLEFLMLFLDQVPITRLLAVLTFRPDFTPPWRSRSHLAQLTLNRLGRHPVEAMVEQITSGKPLPREVVQQIIAKTDGVPLFVEELTKMVLESGLLTAAADRYELQGPLPPLAIPNTLQDSLMARLDRLATTRETAQVGATLGREFSYELLHAVSPLDEATLQQGLRQLVDAELLYQRGLPPQATYLFKHALVQDTAYQSLLKSKRQQYHQQIARVLAERFPETTQTQPELLAHHYTEAGLIAQAIPYWQQAGQRASQRSAYVEAVSHLTKGLEVLKILPDTPERTRQELDLQVILGPALIATKGWGAPELEKAYSRARELCQQVGETSRLFPVLWGLWVFYYTREELRKAHALGEQLFNLAQSVQDSALLLEAHMTLGYTLHTLGEFVPARDHLEQSIALYDPQQHHALAFLYGGADPGMAGLSGAAWVLWMLGYPDQARERSRDAVTLARELSHPHSLAFALCFAAEFHQFCGERQSVQEHAEALIILATEQGLPYFVERGLIARGWALSEQGQGEEGIAQIRQGLAAYRARGAELYQSHFLALLAEAYRKVGQTAEGLAAVTEALDWIQRTGGRYYEAELYRLKGELSLQSRQVKTSLKTPTPDP